MAGKLARGEMRKTKKSEHVYMISSENNKGETDTRNIYKAGSGDVGNRLQIDSR